MRPRVLVTRPEPGASRTAARLRQAGFEPVNLPLTQIETLEHALPAGYFDAVIVTSAQALKRAITASILHLPLYAVGETTAESARAAGFANVMTADGNIESIAALVMGSAKPAARLLYLCGKVRRPELEATLGEAGFHLTAVETYDAVPVAYSNSEIAARLGGLPFDAVLLMSARAAELFAELADEPDFAPFFSRTKIFCLSRRIADALVQQSIWRICVTKNANEGSMLELLKSELLLDHVQASEPSTF